MQKKKNAENCGLCWGLQPQNNICFVPQYHMHPGYSAPISAAFSQAPWKAWIKLMQGHVFPAYYLLQF